MIITDILDDFFRAALNDTPVALRTEVQKLITQTPENSRRRHEFIEILIKTGEELASLYGEGNIPEKSTDPKKTSGIAYKSAYCLESAALLSTRGSEQRMRAISIFPIAAARVQWIETTQPNYTHPISIYFKMR